MGSALAKMATPTKMEFNVEMTCQSCSDAIKKALEGNEEVLSYNINLADEQVIIETTLPSDRVKDILEGTGRRAVMKGHGSITASNHLGAAVSILEAGPTGRGVIRFLQASEKSCIIEGTIDGLAPGQHALNIHEFGDLSNECNSCGNHFNPFGKRHNAPTSNDDRHVGDLGNITADDNGRASFRLEDNQVKVWDIIGRSIVVHAGKDDLGMSKREDGNSGPGLACGIIARSAGLFQNTKKICSCDGVVLWDERDRPLAGPGRKQP